MKQQNDSGGTAPELQLPLHPSEEFRPKLNGWTTDGNRIQTCPEYAWGFIPRSQVLYYLNDEGGNGWKADYSGILPLKWVIGKWCWYIDPDSEHPHAGERFDWGIECWRPRDEGDFDLEKLIAKLRGFPMNDWPPYPKHEIREEELIRHCNKRVGWSYEDRKQKEAK